MPLSAPEMSVVTQDIPNVWPFAIFKPVRLKLGTFVTATVPFVPVAAPVKSLPFRVVLPDRLPVPLQSKPEVFENLHCS